MTRSAQSNYTAGIAVAKYTSWLRCSIYDGVLFRVIGCGLLVLDEIIVQLNIKTITLNTQPQHSVGIGRTRA